MFCLCLGFLRHLPTSENNFLLCRKQGSLGIDETSFRVFFISKQLLAYSAGMVPERLKATGETFVYKGNKSIT